MAYRRFTSNKLIPDDDPASIILSVEQVKVAHRTEQKTEIELLY
jgi:hypothetical protein